MLQYASMLIKNQQFRTAQPLVEKHLKLHTKSAEAWALMGLIQMKNNQAALARQSFNKALSFNPDQLTALNNLLSLESLLGNKSEVDKIQKRINAIRK